MKEDLILKCLIAFVLGYLVSRMMSGNGLMVGGQDDRTKQKESYNDNIQDEELITLNKETTAFGTRLNKIDTRLDAMKDNIKTIVYNLKKFHKIDALMPVEGD